MIFPPPRGPVPQARHLERSAGLSRPLLRLRGCAYRTAPWRRFQSGTLIWTTGWRRDDGLQATWRWGCPSRSTPPS